MQPQRPNAQGDWGHPDEDAKMPSDAGHENHRASNPGSSAQTILQENQTVSLLLSSPLTSPLISLGGTVDPTPSFTPRHYHTPAQPLGPRFTNTNASHPAYDPNRGAQLRIAADRANPYRDRLGQADHGREQERTSSRSPRRLVQAAGLSESRERPRNPFMAFNQYPREMYVPPGLNDLRPQNLPSSSPIQSPNNTKHGHGHAPAMDHPWDSHGRMDSLDDGDLYEYPRDPPQQVQGGNSGPLGHQPDKPEEDTKDSEEEHLCEFAAPCKMHPSPDGMHYRKVVSHVFGRNKAVTKLFPIGVWVHYCRKHYQRARYRADQWPFTQCDLLLESLSRMESWDGVESFELILRRREQIRVGHETEGQATTETSNRDEANASSGQSQNQDHKTSGITTRSPARRHPTAIIAPVPDWLRQHVGHGKTFQEIRHIIELVRSHMVRLRNLERAKQQPSHISKSQNAPGSPRRGSLSNVRKGRIAKPANQDPLRLRASTIRFPDIEILPHFKPWVKEAALRQRSATTCPANEGDTRDYEAQQRLPLRGRITGETSDGHDANSQSDSSQPTSGNSPTNNNIPHCDGSSDYVSTTEMNGANLSQIRAHIGRAGTNRGQSESQRRRSERVYLKAIDRVPGQSLIKKPGKDGAQ